MSEENTGHETDGTQSDLVVSARTNTHTLAFRITREVLEKKQVTLTSGGSHAVNQMVKALAIARARLLEKGLDIKWATYWQDVPGKRDGQTLSLLQTRLYVEPM